ncbi:MAG: NAD(P)H-dependent oxidoreductase subunit E [Armatimonadetes bacterium]|nr:NAD(P)H-dependent oxidoreductase subunit E [Armatimonadota bacterium]
MAVEKTCCASAEEEKAVRTALEAFEPVRTNLIPMLHAVQETLGQIPGWAMEEVAETLNVPVAEVWGTASFYTMFDLQSRAKHIIRLCESPPCHITGAAGILDAIQEELGIGPGEVTPDGVFGLELVSCFGVCGVAPAMIVDHEVHGNLRPEMVPQLLQKYREQ